MRKLLLSQFNYMLKQISNNNRSATSKLSTISQWMEKLRKKEWQGKEWCDFNVQWGELNKMCKKGDVVSLEKEITNLTDKEKIFALLLYCPKKKFTLIGTALNYKQTSAGVKLYHIAKENFSLLEKYKDDWRNFLTMEIFHTSSLLNALCSSDLEYKLCFSPNEKALEKGILYIKFNESNANITYTVISPENKTITDIITTEQLPLLKEPRADERKLQKTQEILPEILAITSTRGHTYNNKNDRENLAVELIKDAAIAFKDRGEDFAEFLQHTQVKGYSALNAALRLYDSTIAMQLLNSARTFFHHSTESDKEHWQNFLTTKTPSEVSSLHTIYKTNKDSAVKLAEKLIADLLEAFKDNDDALAKILIHSTKAKFSLLNSAYSLEKNQIAMSQLLLTTAKKILLNKKHLHLLKELLTHETPENHSPLNQICRLNCDKNIVVTLAKYLIDCAKETFTNDYENFANFFLHKSKGRFSALNSACEAGNTELVVFLLNVAKEKLSQEHYKKFLTGKTEGGFSPISSANRCKKNEEKTKIISILLKAEIDAGLSPLHRRVCNKNNFKLIKIVIEKIGEIFINDNKKLENLWLGVDTESGNSNPLLLAACRAKNMPNDKNIGLKLLKLLFGEAQKIFANNAEKLKKFLSASDIHGYSLLNYLCDDGQKFEVTKELINIIKTVYKDNNGILANHPLLHKTNKNFSPLADACKKNNKKLASLLINSAIELFSKNKESLIDFLASANDKGKNSPFYLAVKFCDTEIIDELLDVAVKYLQEAVFYKKLLMPEAQENDLLDTACLRCSTAVVVKILRIAEIAFANDIDAWEKFLTIKSSDIANKIIISQLLEEAWDNLNCRKKELKKQKNNFNSQLSSPNNINQANNKKADDFLSTNQEQQNNPIITINLNEPHPEEQTKKIIDNAPITPLNIQNTSAPQSTLSSPIKKIKRIKTQPALLPSFQSFRLDDEENINKNYENIVSKINECSENGAIGYNDFSNYLQNNPDINLIFSKKVFTAIKQHGKYFLLYYCAWKGELTYFKKLLCFNLMGLSGAYNKQNLFLGGNLLVELFKKSTIQKSSIHSDVKNFLNYKINKKLKLSDYYCSKNATVKEFLRIIDDENNNTPGETSDEELINDSFVIIKENIEKIYKNTKNKKHYLLFRGRNFKEKNVPEKDYSIDHIQRMKLWNQEQQFIETYSFAKNFFIEQEKSKSPNVTLDKIEEQADVELQSWLDSLKNSKDKPEHNKQGKEVICMHNGNPIIFETLYTHFLHTYLNRYGDLFAPTKNRITKDFDLPAEFKGRNPLISTSETPNVYKYASGEFKDWSWLPHFNKLTGTFKGKTFGFIQFFLIDEDFYNKNVVSLDQLMHEKIFPKYFHSKGKEHIVYNGNLREHLIGYKMLSLPSFAKPWNEKIRENYGLSKKQYEEYQKSLKNFDGDKLQKLIIKITTEIAKYQTEESEKIIREKIKEFSMTLDDFPNPKKAANTPANLDTRQDNETDEKLVDPNKSDKNKIKEQINDDNILKNTKSQVNTANNTVPSISQEIPTTIVEGKSRNQEMPEEELIVEKEPSIINKKPTDNSDLKTKEINEEIEYESDHEKNYNKENVRKKTRSKLLPTHDLVFEKVPQEKIPDFNKIALKKIELISPPKNNAHVTASNSVSTPSSSAGLKPINEPDKKRKRMEMGKKLRELSKKYREKSKKNKKRKITEKNNPSCAKVSSSKNNFNFSKQSYPIENHKTTEPNNNIKNKNLPPLPHKTKTIGFFREKGNKDLLNHTKLKGLYDDLSG